MTYGDTTAEQRNRPRLTDTIKAQQAQDQQRRSKHIAAETARRKAERG
jgi:hypothetical protein